MNTPTSESAGALVVLEQGPERAASSVPRPLAGFVAQLIACRESAPAYRARRRASPDLAIACYGGAAASQAPRLRRTC